MEDQRELLQAALVLRTHAHRDRRRARVARTARVAGGGCAEAHPRHPDPELRPWDRDRERTEPADAVPGEVQHRLLRGGRAARGEGRARAVRSGAVRGRRRVPRAVRREVGRLVPRCVHTLPRLPAAHAESGRMKDINPRFRQFQEYRESVRELCAQFDSRYWQENDAQARYPEEFVKALTDAGWLAALIPAEYGGGGMGVTEASVILEEVTRSGANSGACHAQMYIMGTLLRHGSVEQKRRYLPAIARGELRLQSFAVTEPSAGNDTTKIKTVAVKRGDRYVVNGQKIWISRVQHSDLMLLLARTTPVADVKKKSDGLSVF